MRVGLIMAAVIIGMAGAGMASAQTIYNAPGAGSGSVQPLNLRELMRRDQATRAPQQSDIPYATAPGASAGATFAQRQAALNQWRQQRDAQAWADQQRSQDYMVALAESPGRIPFDMPLTQTQAAPADQAAPAQPARPMIYRGAGDNDPIQKPRRLFNTLD